MAPTEYTPIVRTRPRWTAPIALGFSLVVLLAGPNVPTPLYPIYEQAFGFSPLLITVLFAAYALVLIPALLVFGPASDAVGRRRVLLPATAVAALGAVLFAVATGPVWLFAARVAQGLALGAAQGTATAALGETDPDANASRAALVGSLSVVGGIAVGPLLGGLLAQYAPAPLVLPYAVEAALLVAALAGLAWTLPRERGSSGPGHGARWRPRRPSIPAPMRRCFVLSGLSAFVAFSVSALFLTLMPAYVGKVAHSGNLALAGAVVAVMLGAAAVVQAPLRSMSTRRAQVLGLALMALGLLGVLAAAWAASLAVLLAASVVTGLGQGLAFGGSLAAVITAAPAGQRGEVLSSYYVTVYLGLAVPVIGIGLVALGLGQLAAAQVFAGIIIIACLGGIAAHQLDAHRPTRGPETRPAAEATDPTTDPARSR